LVSRQGKPIRGMDHIIDALKTCEYPVDMELVVPGLEFNKLSGLIRNHQAVPTARAYIIDMPSPGNLRDRLMRRPKEIPGVLYRIPHYKVESLQGFWDLHYRWLAVGLEGSVWKSLGHEYSNTRNYDWMREVPIKSEDCRILDIYEGCGKMSGILGGFIIDFNGLECRCGTLKDFDYALRREIFENPDQYIGQVLEVQYKNLQPSGKPRQPRGKGFRYDKA